VLMLPQKISYAKSKSHKIAKLDGTFRMPGTAGAAAEADAAGKPFVALPGAVPTTAGAPGTAAAGAAASPAADAVAGQKRQREEDSGKPCSHTPEDIVQANVQYRRRRGRDGNGG
jgi:U2 small nuclear ribonucleoprotein B''